MRAKHRCLGVLLAALAISLSPKPAAGQDWFRTAIGMDIQKPRVAVADFVPRAAEAPPHSKLFTDVVRDDLQFSGILDVVSPSFYPLPPPSLPPELRQQAWASPPVSAHVVAFGNLSENASEAAIQAWLYDVRNTAAPPVIGKIYRGAPTDAVVRKLAHQFADEIIGKLSGGVPGLGTSQIAFVSSRTGTKEIWAMDYDGGNQHALTSLHTIALTPRWSPDGSRIAFTCFAPAFGVVSPQICMYSLDTGRTVAFGRFRGTNSAPTWSPDGTQVMFSSSMQGSPELYVSDASGNRPKRLTFATGASTSPAWNPKTGQTVAFVSDRGGIPKLFLMNADGTNLQQFDLPDMGYVIDPAWSPNGQLLAFSWRRPNGNYDIYVMEVATQRIIALTRDQGRNERPWWAPDGRHLVFESTRSGSRQIWVMVADGSQPKQLTQNGTNESPNWSWK